MTALINRAVSSLSGILSSDVPPEVKRAIAEAVIGAVNPVRALRDNMSVGDRSDYGAGFEAGCYRCSEFLRMEGWPDAGSGEGG